MIFDMYNTLKDEPGYSKLVGNDYLFLEYKCPIESEIFQFMTELNFITYVISGKKDWITPGETIGLKEGDALFLRKGAYTTRQYFEEDHCVLTFFITDDFIRNFNTENRSISLPQSDEPTEEQAFQLDVNEPLKTLFYSMYSYLKMGKNTPRNLVELKFKELLFNIILNPRNKRLAQFFTSLNQAGKTNLDYVMMKNFHYELQLEEFARLCGRSLSAFKRDFKNHYHKTPGKWLNDKRLEHAKSLLLNSDMNVNEVCQESGFRNSSHFNKAFKERYKLPPNQFRIKQKVIPLTP